MGEKTIKQLQKEIASLKKKERSRLVKINEAAIVAKEKRELEQELKELKSSPAMKRLRRFSKSKLNKKKLREGGKATATLGKTLWNTAGKIVNKLDKIQV